MNKLRQRPATLVPPPLVYAVGLGCGWWLQHRWPYANLCLYPGYGVIMHEERYLTDQFGEDYLAYTSRVKRWIGRAKLDHKQL